MNKKEPDTTSLDDETKQDQTKQETVIQQVTTNAEDNNAATELEEKSASENTVAKTVQPEEKEVNQQVADPTKDSTETEDDATAKQVETQTFEVKRDTKAVSEKALSESKAQDETKHTDFIIDKDTVGSNDQITINLNTNEAKVGDIYKIVIPEVGDGLDASGTYEASPGKFQGYYGSADEPVYDEEKKAWAITDRFTKTNSNNQPIVLTTKSNFDQNKLHSTGTFARKAYLYKNDELIKTLDFNQNVGSSASLWWDSLEGVYGGSSHSVYTMDNNETSVSDSSRGPEFLANTDYKWKLNTCFSPNFNHGTEIDGTQSVASVKVAVDQKDGKVDITVVYKAPEKAGYKIHYIDLGVDPKKTTDLKPDDGKELTGHQVTVNGDVGYVTDATDKLWNYDPNNYEFVSASNDLAKIKIEKGIKDQYVYVKHHTTTNTQTTTLHENIKYQFEDGSATNLPDYDRTIKYSLTRVHDDVNNTDSDWTSWTPDKGQKDTSFEDVSSSTIPGYTSDKSEIKAPVPVDGDYVNGKTHDYKYVVKYKANPQKITVNYIDDTAGKTLSSKELNGKSDEHSGYDTKSSISDYKAQQL
ncbi:hypothetical protein QFX17_04250 [Lactobacillus helveticus]|uniref:mucin-binding protein n=2 Tax=Lactobacillus TaxID=1578 RepID=UPI0015622CB2|nr:hypothetical protein [Lactobacillus helveticus]MDN6022523.1 hypothetical protein [Lactobacillus sp.]MCO0808232.1 hypothetical protein [Lactobacillus helveticus]MCP9317029.1 hypothetical protein [Lactobacillus helveticus]MDH5817479.1 hypothetical protein [Lactobacillus helveticus]MDN6039156.1 hypothetical protein [Lactobacillus sp.]